MAPRSLLCLVGMVAASLVAGCASDTHDSPFDQSAQAEIARRPAWYSNGDTRSFLVSQGGQVRGVIWGTIHVAYGGDTVLPSPIRRYLDDATDLTVEVALERMSTLDQTILRNDVLAAVRAPDPAAVQRLDAATRAAIGELPSDQASRLSLFGLRYAVAARIATGPAGPLPQLGIVDLNLINFARQRTIPVFGLERPAVQENILLSEPNGADAASELQQLVRQRETTLALKSWVADAYGQGRVAAVAANLDGWLADEADRARIDRRRQVFLSDRNAAWVERLDARLTVPGLHFVAFGAGHLLGEDGVVALLRQKGWTVSPCFGDVCQTPQRT